MDQQQLNKSNVISVALSLCSLYLSFPPQTSHSCNPNRDREKFSLQLSQYENLLPRPCCGLSGAVAGCKLTSQDAKFDANRLATGHSRLRSSPSQHPQRSQIDEQGLQGRCSGRRGQWHLCHDRAFEHEAHRHSIRRRPHLPVGRFRQDREASKPTVLPQCMCPCHSMCSRCVWRQPVMKSRTRIVGRANSLF